MSVKAEIIVFGRKVRVVKVGEADYFCLTDLAKHKNPERPNVAIRAWMSTRRETEFLYEWENRYNESFKHTASSVFKGFEAYMVEVFLKGSCSPANWVKYTNATGFIVKRGKYGGTYAHSTIALNFANYIESRFYIYLLEEYQVYKNEQLKLMGDPRDLKRFLTAGNYSLLVSAIFSQMDERLLSAPQPYKSRTPFQSEADLLNQIVFGTSAKAWRLINTDKPADKNMRDYASVLDLIILNNLQFLDTMLLQWDCDQEEREKILQEAYDYQYPILKRSKVIQKLQGLADKVGKE